MVPVTESAPFTVSEAAESVNDPATVSGPLRVNDVLVVMLDVDAIVTPGNVPALVTDWAPVPSKTTRPLKSARRPRPRPSFRRSGSSATPTRSFPRTSRCPRRR